MGVHLAFDGIIGESPNTAADVRAALRAGGPVAVSINSIGGVATEGLAIYNLLKAHAGRVDVTIDAIAASAASLIAMAGDRIEMRAGSLLMIHDPSALTIGPASAHEKSRDVLDKLAGEFAKIYASRSGLSEEETRSLMLEEKWMTESEAVDFGFADAASSVTARACAPFDVAKFNFHNMPAQIAALATRTPPMTIVPNPPVDVTADLYGRCTAARLTLEEANVIVASAAGDAMRGRDLIIEAVAKKAGDQTFVPGDHDTLGNPNTLAAAVSDVLYARMTGKPVAKGTPAEELAGRSLLDLGAMTLQANGVKIKSWQKDRLATQIMNYGGSHSTSDFPILTQEAGSRVLLAAYEVAQSPLKQVARRRSADDFRAIAVARLGEMPALVEVGEGAEITYGSRTESHESFRLRTWARIFAITRNALINDDLGAFADSARAWGIAAAQVEANELYSIVAGSGVVMEDGKTLWHADHANVAGSPSALDVDGLSAGRQSIRTTLGLDGSTRLGLAPQFLVVGPANETYAEQVLATLNAAQVSDVNPFAGKLTLLVEPRIEDFAWMMFASPASAEVLSYANLGDRTGPELQTKEGWSVLGIESRCVHDFGAGATGWRGAFKNAGAEPSED